MSMNSSRRDILKLAALTGAGLALPRLSFAQNLLAATPAAGAPADNFFVLLRIAPAGGGLDATLGLDPWLKNDRPLETDMFVEYQPNDVVKAGNLYFGPAAKSLAPYASDLLVVNGVFMSANDNGHPAAIAYMSTGNGQGRAADLPVELEVVKGETPYGLMSGTGSLYTALRRISYVRAGDVLAARNDQDPSTSLERAVQDPHSPLQHAIQDIIAAQPYTLKLQKTLNQMATGGATLSDAHVVAASFLAGASRHSEIDIGVNGSLDTHSNHEGVHLASQTEAWGKVVDIFQIFKSLPYGAKGESLFDRTTFMVISDFSRTPALNQAKGKDHNPMTNSILLAGYGLQKNKTINASLLIEAARSKTKASYHMGSPFDYATGLPAKTRTGASFIYPQNVVISVAKAVGVDLTKFDAVPKTTSIIPGFAI